MQLCCKRVTFVAAKILQKSSEIYYKMQKASAFLSFLCAIHCLAMPILAALLASTATLPILEHPLIEFLLLSPLLGMISYSIYSKIKQSYLPSSFILPILGIICIIIGTFTHLHTLVGASALALAIWQWKNKTSKNTCCIDNKQIKYE